MKFETTKIPEVILLKSNIFNDERGFFFESFNKKKFDDIVNSEINFVQDNHSKSTFGVLRGLHYQKKPFEQGKLVRVSAGEIFDVAVDIRPNSKTFSKWVGVKLSSENNFQLWIPPGFAHGFIALSSIAEVQYKTTDYYDSNSELNIDPFDSFINIEWGLPRNELVLSKKDLKGLKLNDAIKKYDQHK